MNYKPILHLHLSLEDSSNMNMQRTRVRCDVLQCAYHHASERLNRVHIDPPLYLTCPLFLGCMDIQVNLILIASAMQNDSEWTFGQWTGFVVIDRL